MGKRGPTAAPTPLKLVRGDRKSRVNRREPVPTSPKAPTMPATLSPEAKVVWRSLAPDMHRRGVLKEWDREAFVVYCEAVVTHREATALIRSEGVRVGSAKNNMLQVAREAAATIRAFSQEFGLTPAARSGITLPEATDESEARRLLS